LPADPSPCRGASLTELRAAWAAVGLFFLLTAVLGLMSDGVHHDDDLMHLLMARWARWFPQYLLHWWGRPGLTIPLAGVAWLGDAATGWHVARALSACVTAAGAIVAVRLAARLGVRPVWLVVVACYLQPLNLMLAMTTLTENFAALYLVGAVALLNAGRPVGASAVFSLLLVIRHEAIALLPVWWLGLLLERPLAGEGLVSGRECDARRPGRGLGQHVRLHARPRQAVAAAVSLWAPLAYNIVFRVLFDEWPFGMFLQPGGSTEYLPTGPLSYVPPALLAVPPVLAGLAIIGAVALLRRGCWLAPALCATYFLVHAASKALGAFASGGYARFMVTVAPLVGVLAAAGAVEMVRAVRQERGAAWPWLVHGGVWGVGWLALELECAAGRAAMPGWLSLTAVRVLSVFVWLVLLTGWATARFGRAPSELWRARVMAGLASLVLLTLFPQVLSFAKPLRLNDEAIEVHRVVVWLKTQQLADAPLFWTNPWVAYDLDLVEHPRAHKGPALLASMPEGTVVIWDSKYSDNDFHRMALDRLAMSRGYEMLKRFGEARQGAFEIRVFRKMTPAEEPLEPDECYPADPMARQADFRGVFYMRPDLRDGLRSVVSPPGSPAE